MDSSGRQARIYPSLVRTIHVAGIERNAAGLLLMYCLILCFAFRLNWVTPSLAVLTLLVVLPALRRATKRDPQILAVYRAHVVRAAIYQGQPPHTHLHRRQARTF
jgi:type IV secretory pathway TrbD component